MHSNHSNGIDEHDSSSGVRGKPHVLNDDRRGKAHLLNDNSSCKRTFENPHKYKLIHFQKIINP